MSGDLALLFGGATGVAVPARIAGRPRRSVDGPGFRLVLDGDVAELAEPGWRLWVVGEVLGYGDIPADGAARAFLRDLAAGRERPAELAGRFLLLAHDAARARFVVLTDRLATLHAYQAGAPARALTTYSPAAYACSRRRLDWLGLAGFFAAGFFPGEHTHYDDVRVLRPSTRISFDEAGAKLDEARTWFWPYAPEHGLAPLEAARRFDDVLRRVLARHAAASRLAVPVSGGLDSRTLVAALTDPAHPLAERARLWLFSYGYTAGSIETDIARRVAAARGLPLEALVVPPYLFGRIPELLSVGEGFVELTLYRQAAVSELLRAHATHVLGGHWGDVWLDDMGLALEPPPGDDATIEHAIGKMLKRGRAWALQHVVAPRLPDPERAVESLLAGEVRALSHIDDPDMRVKSFKTEQWSFRWTVSAFRSYELGATLRLPFYDAAMVDFFMTIPSPLVARRMLQVEHLRATARDLALVDWQAYGGNLFQYPDVNMSSWPRRIWRRLGRELRRQKVIERNWEVQLGGDEGRRGLETWLLAPGRRVHEFVAPAAVRGLLAELRRRPSAGTGFAVTHLLTFATWLEAQP